jgi:hypothetical protein
MTRTNILRAQKQRGGSPTTELALRDAGNVARVNFILLASLKITAGPTLKDLDPDSIQKQNVRIRRKILSWQGFRNSFHSNEALSLPVHLSWPS